MARFALSGWPQAAALALAAGLVSSIGTNLLTREPPSAPVPATATDAKLDRIIELLDDGRVGASWRASQTAEASSGSITAQTAEPTRTQVASPDLDERLDRIEAAVQRLMKLLTQQGAAVATPIPRHAPIDYSEIAALHALEQGDRDAAQRSTVFLTPLEAVRRFGFPDEIGPANGADFYWTYRAPPGAADGGMMLVFRSGYVAYHQLR